MTDQEAHFRLRIPTDLKEWVDQQARENNRSINAEITWMLRFVKREYDAEMKAQAVDAAETRRIAEEALRVAKEANERWQQNALANNMKPEFRGS